MAILQLVLVRVRVRTGNCHGQRLPLRRQLHTTRRDQPSCRERVLHSLTYAAVYGWLKNQALQRVELLRLNVPC